MEESTETKRNQMRQLEQSDRDTRHTLVAKAQSLSLPYVRAKKMKESRLLTEKDKRATSEGSRVTRRV